MVATSDKNLQASIENQARQVQAQSRALAQSVKDVQKFADALDEASNGAVDKATLAIKDLLKRTKELTDTQVDSIKSAKQLPDLLSKIAIKQQRLLELQKKYEANMKAAGADAKKQREANDKLAKQLANLKVHVTNANDASGSLANHLSNLGNLQAGINRQTSQLGSTSSKAGKAIEALGSRALSSVENMGRLEVAFGMMKKGVTEFYNEAVKMSNRGLLMAMATISTSAIKLRMNFEDFNKMLGENMDLVANLGGGNNGIENFAQQVAIASKNLEYLGKEAGPVAAKNMGALMRAGLGPSRVNSQQNEIYLKNIGAINKQFKLFQSGFGDTIDDFSAYYASVMQSDSVQQRLNTLDNKGVDLMMDEIRQRTENLRVMGLSTKQMQEMNRTLDQMYNPSKNDQSERLSQSVNLQNFVASLMSFANSDEKAVLQGSLGKNGVTTQLARAQRTGDSYSLSTLPTSAAGQQLAQVMSQVQQRAFQSSINSDNPYKVMQLNHYRQGSGPLGDMLVDLGKQSNMTRAASGGANQIGTPEQQAMIQSFKDVSGEGSKLAETFTNLRTVVDQISSVTSNPLISAIGSFTAGVLMMSKSVRGALSGAIKWMISAVTGGAAGFRLALKGMVGGLLGILKKIPGFTAAIAGLEAAWDGFHTDTEDYYTRSGIDRDATVVPQFAKDLGVRSLGLLTDLGAAAGRGISFGLWDPSKNFADKQQKANSLGGAIAQGESGAKGYSAANASNVGGKVTGTNLDPSKMTIGEILRRQSLKPGDPDKLLAVGKYQFTRGALLDVTKALNLSPNTVFSPDVQEQIFQKQLQMIPSVANYLSGRSNDVNAATQGIAQKWSSVASPYTGASLGGAGNKATISAQTIASQLQSMRAGGGGAVVGSPIAAPEPSMTSTGPVPGATPAQVINMNSNAELKKQTVLLQQIAANTGGRAIAKPPLKQSQEQANAKM